MSYTESRDALGTAALDFDRRAQPLYVHPILLDGRLIGRWRLKPNADPPLVETFFHEALKRTHVSLLKAAAQRFGEFLGVGSGVAISDHRRPR